MRLKLTCQDTVRLVLEGEDRALPLGERVLIRVHLGYCRGCTRFSKQVHLMRGAMDGWRRYADGSDERSPTSPPGR
ncbi:zf-HC2 domain-containing protein [uncultured Sphaerotilus sp.]|uniref:anti-sigma factor family protein n=1 Tax=uncultured Sphaerotilus sp. TaxID=474984 RepID=UPI0030CA36BA